MTLTEFIIYNLGKKLDFYKKGNFQCVDLYRFYLRDVLNVPQSPALGENGGAKDIIDNPGVLKVMRDSLLADYSKGDVLIWGASKTNRFGHVAILVKVYNTKYFIVLEQDGFKKDGVKLGFRSRENLLGCLYKKA